MIGGVLHSMVQFDEPDWNHRADIHPEQAIETRKRLHERLLRSMTIAKTVSTVRTTAQRQS